MQETYEQDEGRENMQYRNNLENSLNVNRKEFLQKARRLQE